MQAQIAFARYSHAERTVRKHLNADQLALRSLDLLLLNLGIDLVHLLQVQLARQHDHIRKAGIEFQRLGVGDI